ncbi:C40 family peptidase [Treponema sp.]|uniref:C40 family peptidase n=1 Tax=Treponema sp. TaxID=166 RepID=UPI003F0DE48E
MEKHKKFCKTAAFAFILAASAQMIFSAPKVSESRQKLITYALSFSGVKYVFGGTTPESGFDCSGFIGYTVRNAAGIQLPRSANAIYNYSLVEKIEPNEREPGDLIFFKNDMNSSRITHVGIYCGVYNGKIKEFNGKRVFISSVSDGPKTGVQLCMIDERFWKNHFFAYGRILPRTGA